MWNFTWHSMFYFERWTADCGSSNTSDCDKWRDRVYTLTCITCRQTYVGQTSRSLKLRHQEHIRYIKNHHPQSAYALHILQNRHECGPMKKTMHLLKTHQQYLITNPLWTTLRTISPPRKETDSRTKPRQSEPSVPSGHWPLPPPQHDKTSRTAPSKLHTWPTQRVSAPPPIYELGYV